MSYHDIRLRSDSGYLVRVCHGHTITETGGNKAQRCVINSIRCCNRP